MSFVRNLFLCVLLILPASPVRAEHSDATLLTFLRWFEAEGSYDRYEHRIHIPPPKRLTAMTVGEVLAWQSALRKARVKSTAAGGYQIIYKTLNDLVRRHRITRDTLFNAALQDRLARHLIDDCAAARAHSNTAFANCLAGIWAALPLVSGPKKGLSVYYGIADNKARTTPANVLAMLSGQPFSTKSTRIARETGGAGETSTPRVATPRYVRIRNAMRQTAQAAENRTAPQTWVIDPYAME
ncbi:hypothetical protein [uncultured Ruegeria sp.]|uniref:hypothetical protein n=1 Tax=uncultured Ruegeria sp. TaxID=259304 RepID=UPI002612B837|nr:hypothetical protein [uncultured Ruegeria sp.]